MSVIRAGQGRAEVYVQKVTDLIKMSPGSYDEFFDLDIDPLGGGE
jgi:hypothetical protein